MAVTTAKRVDEQDHRLLAIWASDYAERVPIGYEWPKRPPEKRATSLGAWPCESCVWNFLGSGLGLL
jgi:hypothetical protein